MFVKGKIRVSICLIGALCAGVVSFCLTLWLYGGLSWWGMRATHASLRAVAPSPAQLTEATTSLFFSREIDPARSETIRRSILAGGAVGFCFGAFTYVLLFIFIRRPVRAVLSRMSSEILTVDEEDFESYIDELRSVKRAVYKLQKAVGQGREIRKTILSSINEGFQLLDLDGRTVEVNPALCQMVGIQRERFIEETMPFFYLTEEGQGLGQEFIELIRRGETGLRRGFEGELTWSDKDASKVRLRLCAVEDEDSAQSYVCVFVSSPDAKSEQQFNVQELGKMTLLVKFAGSIAHNLNNTFTGILSAVSLFEKNKIDEGTRLHLLGSMREAVKRGSALCNELLHMSKVRQVLNNRRPVDIVPIVHGVVRMASDLQEAKRHEIIVSVPERPTLALCDESGLHHVLLNLILNSIDAMVDSGKVHVSVSSHNDGPVPEVIIQVSDTGIGMKPETKQMIFTPYFTTKKGRERKKTFGGSGLGLASALESVRSWGGSIDCDSQLGQGTTFVVRLPCAVTVDRGIESAR